MARQRSLPVLVTAAVIAMAVSTAQAGKERVGGSGVDWTATGGDRGGTRYSTLDQIDRDSVRRLQLAWTYHTGDADPAKSTNIECTPVVIDGVMYLTTCNPRIKVAALDAATGRELWKYDPFASTSKDAVIASGGVNRGVAFWEGGRQRRILVGTADGRLISLDTRTGRPDPAFGTAGEVDLRAGIERDIRRLPYGMTSAPAIYRDLAILGFANGEGTGPGAPGDVRAFNVRTGKEVWRFRTVPRPGEFGSETWNGDGWKERGGCNAWSGASVDEKNGLVFVGTGSPAFDFYGGDRKGDTLFGNCTIALDARTGKRVWHYQTVRHDLFDYDNPTPPVVCTVRQNGKPREAVAQVTKTGVCWLFDRKTGEPLFPVEERSVPASDIPGEFSSPTQPLPVKPPPFSRQSFGPDDVTDLSPESKAYVLNRMKTMRYGSIFTPTGFQDTVRVPGFLGGANWSGASFDPTNGMLYVNSNNIPREHRLEKMPAGSPYPYRNTGYGRFVDQNGYPGIKPPWGNLTAIDLSKGELAWQSVLGEYPELIAKGLPPTGTENLGGTIVTAGGLVFIGGTKDEKFRAFDKTTGKVLWEAKLPAGGYATPCTYSVKGRQYVAIAAGGGGKQATKSGDAYVAFALPEGR
ncbi:MAG: gcd [Armatimonadetes bacterium]|jgi:quinoprotein glucose dehydrogenase|nr:gcd [Armatimonadota bacterium]